MDYGFKKQYGKSQQNGWRFCNSQKECSHSVSGKDILSQGMKDEEIEEVNVYIKPEESSVFYVVNKKIQGQIPF